MSWQTYSKTLLLSCALTLSVVYGLILLIDPYDSLPFSPAWERYPVSRHSRDHNAVLARRPQYDSAVFGTSTAMLLHPETLNHYLGGRFVMLGMPAASPFEQMALMRLFRRHHTSIRTLIVGLDRVWCNPNGAPRFLGLMVNQAFPYWLYDENPWNDLPALNRNSIDKASMQVNALLGVRIKYPKKPDGYWDFTDALYKQNDAESVRKRLYDPNRELLPAKKEDGAIAYPDLGELESLLAELPYDTKKILFFVPYHHFQLPEPNSDQMDRLQACKRRTAAIADKVPNTSVVDFMIHSRITENDANYIDGVHYTPAVATEVARMLSRVQQGEVSGMPELRLLSGRPQKHRTAKVHHSSINRPR